MKSVLSKAWSFVLWQVFMASLAVTLLGGKILDDHVDGTQKRLISIGAIVLSLVAGSLLARREPLKSFLATRKVLWFLFLFNAAIAVAAFYFVGGPKGIGAAVGMGLVALGAGFGLLKRAPKPAPALAPAPPAPTWYEDAHGQADHRVGGRAGRHRGHGAA